MKQITSENRSASPVDDFIRHTLTSLDDNTFVRLLLSGGTGDEGAPKRILARLVKLCGGPHLSVTLRYATRDEAKNLGPSEVAKWLGFQLKGNFRSALLGTTVREWQLNFPPDKEPWLISHKPHSKTAPVRDHDEAKQTWLNRGAPRKQFPISYFRCQPVAHKDHLPMLTRQNIAGHPGSATAQRAARLLPVSFWVCSLLTAQAGLRVADFTLITQRLSHP